MDIFAAVKSKKLSEVTRLIDEGVNINGRLATDKNKTPLMLAIEAEHSPIAKLLADKGADLNILDDDGNTALTYACRHDKFDIVKYLTEKGANVCKRSPLLEATKQSDLTTAKYLIENGDEFSTHSALLLAVAMGKLDFVKMLLENKAEVNFEKDGTTPILMAVAKNHFDIAKLLIENRANVNFEGPEGITPLLKAIEINNLELVKLLVEKGALVNKNSGTYPIIRSVQKENCKILQYLLQAGARFIDRSMQEILLNTAAENEDFASIKCLIAAGIECNAGEERLERLSRENPCFALYFKTLKRKENTSAKTESWNEEAK